VSQAHLCPFVIGQYRITPVQQFEPQGMQHHV
jgi:hypothetical protein